MPINNQAAALNFGINGGGNINLNNGKSDQIPAEFWVNIGYNHDTGKLDEQGQPVMLFVQLPFGVPLETPETLKAKKVFMTPEKLAFLAMVTEQGEALKPGETAFIGGYADGLLIQLRRVNHDKPVADVGAKPTIKFGMRA
jgi:hypothetical protein